MSAQVIPFPEPPPKDWLAYCVNGTHYAAARNETDLRAWWAEESRGEIESVEVVPWHFPVTLQADPDTDDEDYEGTLADCFSEAYATATGERAHFLAGPRWED